MRNYSEKESSVIRNVLSGQVVSEIARVSAEMKSYLPIPDFLDALVNDTIKAYIGANYRQIKLGIIVLAACRPGLFEKYHNANFFSSWSKCWFLWKFWKNFVVIENKINILPCSCNSNV